MPVASNKFEQQMAANPTNIYGLTRNPNYDSNWNPVGGGRFPKVNFATTTSSVAPATTINTAATTPSESQATLAAQNAPLRVIYGRVRLGAQIANILAHGSYWIIQAVWGEGPVESIESVEINDDTVPAGVVVTHYLGDAVSPVVDPTLAAAFSAAGRAYGDTLPGIAYSVFKLPGDSVTGLPNIVAVINGRKVYDPRTTTTVWSDNPALCLADFLGSTVYGAGRTVNDAALETAADACDEVVGGVARRRIGLAIDAARQVSEWAEVLRTYAGCWILSDGGETLLVPDRPRATDATITHAAGQVSKIDKIKRRGIAQVPTVIEIRYTDTSATPWRESSVWAYADGVLAGTTPWRESQIALPGVQSAAQAYREAVERLNKLALSDLSFSLEVFDEGAAYELGNVVEVTHPIGLAAKKMRILGISGAYGRYSLNLAEYDPAVYSDSVATEPTYADTDLPNPAAPPELVGLAAVEEVYQLETGTYASRIRLTWDAPEWAYLHRYAVELRAAGVVVATYATDLTEWASPPVAEGVEYVCRVSVVSSVGATGAPAQANIVAAGKYLIPGNVPSLSAFEAGGRVYASWAAAVDLDIYRYEVRYGSTAGAWDSATLIDRVDALRLTSDTIPVGTWRLYVKALDSVGQYSATAATADVVVTSDVNSFLVDSYDQTSPTLTNMVAYTLEPTDPNTYYVTDTGAAADTLLMGATLAAYTNPLSTYHASCTSTWLGESEDFGSLLGGNWAGTATVDDVSGAHSSSMGFSTDGSSWSYLSGLAHKTNARFSRLKHEATTTSTMRVTVPTQNIRLDAIPREEVGTGATTGTSSPATVALSGEYVAVKKLTITPEGTTARSATYDNINLTAKTFDVYVFNDAGAPIASNFRYQFQGV